MVPAPLPVESVMGDLLEALEGTSSVVLSAPTGAGKTTRVPPALLDAGYGDVWMLEPRRIAARAAAARMAQERGGKLGAEIGYRVRFDARAGSSTRLCVATEGIFLRRLQEDPFLEGIGCVVFDEFHERGLAADLALAMVRRLQAEVRPELRIVVMSATLDVDLVAGYLEPCGRVVSEGRLFPVELRYLSPKGREPLEVHLERGIREAFAATNGDLLAFLPGVGEIRRAADHLAPWARKNACTVVELYGDLPPERQDAALFRGSTPNRRVVLATNVAETSVTVEGITAVVDSGLARVPSFDPHTGLDRLERTSIARDSADQRSGRAGRLGPGLGVRLWSEMEQRAMAPRTAPELERVDLAPAVLELACWGESDPFAFPWLEAPSADRLEGALTALRRLGAIGPGPIGTPGRPGPAAGAPGVSTGATELGRRLARIPAHPRLGRLLVEGARLGVPGRAARAAALLSERDPFVRDRRDSGGTTVGAWDSDVLERIVALEDFEDRGRTDFAFGRLPTGRARFLLRAAQQFARSVEGIERDEALRYDGDEAFLRALLAAFPDRLARRRGPGSDRAQMVGGRGVRLGRESGVTEPELFVCIELGGSASEPFVRLASGVEEDWLDPEFLEEGIECAFDPATERVEGQRIQRWNGLLLRATEHAGVDPDVASRLLVEAGRDALERVVDRREPELESLLTRWMFLREEVPELQLPPCDDGAFIELLESLAAGCRSFADLRRAPWLASLAGRLSHEQSRALEREAPERLEVPSGSRLKLTYEAGRPPVLAARIQELFGWTETPRVARGRVKVLIHLLAPNGRPQQVTDDLDSFWRNTYALVRKDLRARYPKHAWPEDPLSAPAERRPRRSKKSR